MRLKKWLAVGLVIGGLVAGGSVFARSRGVEPSPAPALQPTMELSFAPAPVAQTPDGTAGLVPITVRSVPAEEGQEVLLQRRGSSWTDEAIAVQDADGVAFFAVPVEPNVSVGFRARPADQVAPEVQTGPVRVRVKDPSFNDDFDEPVLDPAKWQPRLVGVRNAKGQRACAESAAAMVSVADGAAVLEVAQIPADEAEGGDGEVACPSGEFFNGHIGTQETFKFRYGTMAARIRFPAEQGQHGAFWSQPDKLGKGAEIDAVEYFGDEFPAKGELAGSSALQHSIYWESEEGPRKVGGLFDVSELLPDGETWADDFHVYSVEWTPTEYIFRVDGHETFRTSEGVSDVRQYLILSLLTSDWELPRLDTAALSPMEVDWVRVWRGPSDGVAPSESATG